MVMTFRSDYILLIEKKNDKARALLQEPLTLSMVFSNPDYWNNTLLPDHWFERYPRIDAPHEFWPGEAGMLVIDFDAKWVGGLSDDIDVAKHAPKHWSYAGHQDNSADGALVFAKILVDRGFDVISALQGWETFIRVFKAVDLQTYPFREQLIEHMRNQLGSHIPEVSHASTLKKKAL